MLTWIKSIIMPPQFEDEEKTRIAAMLNIILWTIILILVFTRLILTVINLWQDELPSGNILSIVIGVGFSIVLLGLLRLGWVSLVSVLVVLLFHLITTFALLGGGGLQSPILMSFLGTIVVAGLLLGGRGAFAVLIITLLTMWAISYAETQGLIESYASSESSPFIIYFASASMITLLLTLASRSINRAMERSRRNEQELNQSNQSLRAIQTTLEERVTERTQKLEIVANINEQLSSILDTEQLLNETVEQIKEQLDYYHVHIYLLNQESQNLEVVAGSGSIGDQMKSEGHSIPLTLQNSLVARCARRKQVVYVADVGQDPSWLPNALLPDTQTEMVAPIILGDDLIGVLDVQSDRVGGLDESDEQILRSLVGQTAIAIRNAQLFDETRLALDKSQKTQRHYQEQVWRTGRVSQLQKYHYVQPDQAPLPTEVEDQILKKAWQDSQPRLISSSKDQIENSSDIPGETLVAPIRLGEQTIGALQLHSSTPNQDGLKSWTEQELSLVQAITDQVAQTAENLRLFDETRQRASYERTVGEISQRLRQATSLDALAKMASEEVSAVLGASLGQVSLGFSPEEKLAQVPQEQVPHNGHNDQPAPAVEPDGDES